MTEYNIGDVLVNKQGKEGVIDSIRRTYTFKDSDMVFAKKAIEALGYKLKQEPEKEEIIKLLDQAYRELGGNVYLDEVREWAINNIKKER